MLKDVLLIAAGETDMKGDLIPIGQTHMGKTAYDVKQIESKLEKHSTYVICLDNGMCETSCSLVCEGLENPFNLEKWDKNRIYHLVDYFTQMIQSDSFTKKFKLIIGNISLIIVADKEFCNQFIQKTQSMQSQHWANCRDS